MTDLRERFRDFESLEAPDLWDRIEEMAATPIAQQTWNRKRAGVIAAVAVAALALTGGAVVLERTVWPDDDPEPAYEYEEFNLEADVLETPTVEAASALIAAAGFEVAIVQIPVLPEEREVAGPFGYALLRSGTKVVELGVYADPAATWKLTGEKPAGTWTTFGSEHGLASDCIAGGLAVGPDGTVWAGCTGGLSRFDGETWQVVNSGYDIEQIGVAPDGEVWVSAWAGTECNEYCTSIFRNFAVQPVELPFHDVTLAVDPEGTVWITDGSVYRYDGEQFEQLTDGTAGASLFEISVNGGVAWAAGGEAGLWRYDGEWTEMAAAHGAEALGAAPDGTVWIGYDAASHFDGTISTVTGLESSRIVDWAFAPDGTVWAASQGNGAFRFDGDGWAQYTEVDGLASDRLIAVEMADDGTVWFATKEAGISRFVPNP